MHIASKSDLVTTCEKCGDIEQRYTYKIERTHYCQTCAERKIFKKSTLTTKSLVSQFENGIDYEDKLNLAANIIQKGVGTRKMRVSAAKIQTNIPLDIRNLGHGKYIVLCPAGKKVFNAPNHVNPDGPKPYIDPERPFDSICEHVQRAMNQGLRTKEVAEYIWSIRGKYDYITAMMYEHHVVVTWEHGQRVIRGRGE